MARSICRINAGAAGIGSIRILLAGILLALVGAAGAESPGVSVDVERMVHSWILYRCDVGEEGGSGISLEVLGGESEAILIKAADQGPPPDSMTLFKGRLRENWRTGLQLLESGEETGIGSNLVELLREESEEAFVNRNKSEFSLGYRQKAIIGLASVGTDKARPTLDRLKREGREVLAGAVEEALKSIGRRMEKRN